MIPMAIPMEVILMVILMVEVVLLLTRMVTLTMMNPTLEHQIQSILDFHFHQWLNRPSHKILTYELQWFMLSAILFRYNHWCLSSADTPSATNLYTRVRRTLTGV